MMFHKSMIAGLFVIAAASVALSGSALGAKGGTARPFHGNSEGQVLAMDPSGATIGYAGRASHLGRFTSIEELSFGAAGAISGSIELRAANGDLLYVEFEGGFIAADEAVGTYTIVGGTGRFSGATGAADFQALVGPGGAVSVSFDGTISY